MSDEPSILPVHCALRLIRLKRHVTQQCLAQLANVKRTTMSRYERGNRVISVKRLEVIALALKVDPGLFFRLTNDSPELAALTPFPHNGTSTEELAHA